MRRDDHPASETPFVAGGALLWMMIGAGNGRDRGMWPHRLWGHRHTARRRTRHGATERGLRFGMQIYVIKKIYVNK